ncbi:MAG: hypothetical protein AB1778_09160 [Candidatus Bipolaricaulota bacterium]
MRQRWVFGLVVASWAALSLSGTAAQIGGTVGASVGILPSFTAQLDAGVTVEGDAWSFSSDTTLGVAPTFGIDESLRFVYEVDPATFTATLGLGLLPWAFDGAALSASVDLFDVDVLDEDPTLSIDSTFNAGVELDGAFDAFADLTLRAIAGLADHSLTSATTLSLLPLGITSTLLGSLSLGTVTLGEGDDAATLTTSASALVNLIPFGFSYAQITSTLKAGVVSVVASLTYYGTTSFLVHLSATLDVEPVTLSAWMSYDTTAANLFTLGASATFAWGPVELGAP